jgi:hypothetical protein
MTPHDTGACIRLAQSARTAGNVVSLDIDNVFDGIEALLPLVDILITSSEFPQKASGYFGRKRSSDGDAGAVSECARGNDAGRAWFNDVL